MVHKYRIKKIKRDNISDYARTSRKIKMLKRHSKLLAYTQRMQLNSVSFVKGLARFIGYTYKNKFQTESLVLKIVTWFRIWKFFVFNKANYKFN